MGVKVAVAVLVLVVLIAWLRLYAVPAVFAPKEAFVRVWQLEENPTSFFNLTDEMFSQIPTTTRSYFEEAFADRQGEGRAPTGDVSATDQLLAQASIDQLNYFERNFLYRGSYYSYLTRHYDN